MPHALPTEAEVTSMRPQEAARRLRELRRDRSATLEEFDRVVVELRYFAQDGHSAAAKNAMMRAAIDTLQKAIVEVEAAQNRVADLEDLVEGAAIDAAPMPAAGHA
jgi:hypothetical protein